MFSPVFIVDISNFLQKHWKTCKQCSFVTPCVDALKKHNELRHSKLQNVPLFIQNQVRKCKTQKWITENQQSIDLQIAKESEVRHNISQTVGYKHGSGSANVCKNCGLYLKHKDASKRSEHVKRCRKEKLTVQRKGKKKQNNFKNGLSLGSEAKTLEINWSYRGPLCKTSLPHGSETGNVYKTNLPQQSKAGPSCKTNLPQGSVTGPPCKTSLPKESVEGHPCKTSIPKVSETGPPCKRRLPQKSETGPLTRTSLPQTTHTEPPCKTSLPQDYDIGSPYNTSLPQESKTGSPCETNFGQESKTGPVYETSLPGESEAGPVISFSNMCEVCGQFFSDESRWLEHIQKCQSYDSNSTSQTEMDLNSHRQEEYDHLSDIVIEEETKPSSRDTKKSTLKLIFKTRKTGLCDSKNFTLKETFSDYDLDELDANSIWLCIKNVKK